MHANGFTKIHSYKIPNTLPVNYTQKRTNHSNFDNVIKTGSCASWWQKRTGTTGITGIQKSSFKTRSFGYIMTVVSHDLAYAFLNYHHSKAYLGHKAHETGSISKNVTIVHNNLVYWRCDVEQFKQRPKSGWLSDLKRHASGLKDCSLGNWKCCMETKSHNQSEHI